LHDVDCFLSHGANLHRGQSTINQTRTIGSGSHGR